jgi:hypothetical protein
MLARKILFGVVQFSMLGAGVYARVRGLAVSSNRGTLRCAREQCGRDKAFNDLSFL